MCNVSGASNILNGPNKHKENRTKRKQRDEDDVQLLVAMLSDRMINPFDEDTPKELCNIATGVIAPAEISAFLLDTRNLGKQKMDTFVEERINSGNKSVYDTQKRVDVKTFANLTRKPSGCSANKLDLALRDRQLFTRIMVVAKTRQTHLKTILQHELSCVPCSVA